MVVISAPSGQKYESTLKKSIFIHSHKQNIRLKGSAKPIMRRSFLSLGLFFATIKKVLSTSF